MQEFFIFTGMKKFKRPHIWNALLVVIFCVVFFVPAVRSSIQVTLFTLWSRLNTLEVQSESVYLAAEDYNWRLLDSDGQIYTVADAKNQVIVINFWATWCPPCIAEMSSLNTLYQDYADRVLFLFITTDDMGLVNMFKSKKGYDFPVYNYHRSVPSIFKTSTIPRTMILGKDGQVVVDEHGALDWNSSAVRSLLNDLIRE
jgi:thiol-disulfide isomerase/thioredoxin